MSIQWSSYEFTEPVVLQYWDPPRKSGIYAIMYRPDPLKKPTTFTVVYFGETENFAERGFPWNHESSGCWIQQAGSKNNVYVSIYLMPNSTKDERRKIEQELIDLCKPEVILL